MDRGQFERYSLYAKGLKQADLVLKNGYVVNVFTGEILKQDVAIQEGYIVGVGKYCGKQEIDVSGKYISPGFIDSHLHLESTLVTPSELVMLAAKCGTLTFIADPHEAANVAGSRGIDYILNATENLPANVYVMLPSCVPATPFDDNGGQITAEDMKSYLNHKRVLGLGEVMDCPAVIHADKQMMDKLELFQDKVIDGHAPLLSDLQLNTYALAGIRTDHECADFKEAMRTCRMGMQVLIREGSAAKNLVPIMEGIIKNHISVERFCFCTDDKHIEDIQAEGHISYQVRKSIEMGLAPVDAIRIASWNAARTYGLDELGAIAPGFQADILILNDLKEVEVIECYHKGEKIDFSKAPVIYSCPEDLKKTVNVKTFSRDVLKIATHTKPFPVIKLIKNQILTEKEEVILPGEHWFEANRQYNKIAVFERHKKTGRVGIGILEGFSIKGGAIAISVSHDSHNIIVVGDNDNDMLLAVEELIKSQGGYVLVETGMVKHLLPLPIMGLMSDAGYEAVNESLKSMVQKARQMGVQVDQDPFITLSFLALTVLPQIRITDRGIYGFD